MRVFAVVLFWLAAGGIVASVANGRPETRPAAISVADATPIATPTPRPRPWTGPRPSVYVWTQEVITEGNSRTYRLIAWPRDPLREPLVVSWAVVRYEIWRTDGWRPTMLPPPNLGTDEGVSQRLTVDLSRLDVIYRYQVVLDVSARTLDGERWVTNQIVVEVRR